MKKKSVIKNAKEDVVFLAFDWILLTLFLIIVLYPLLFVISASFSPGMTAMKSLSLIPEKYSLEGYRVVFEYKRVWTGYANSLKYMVLGTIVNLFVTICAAYPLSRDDICGKDFVMGLFVFTMYFSGGLIPTYLQVRNLGLIDTIWAMVLPGAMSVYNMIVMRTYFANQIPGELNEAAELDGCGSLKFLLVIVLPLSGPILAVIGLFYGVGHWNAYFDALLYINKDAKQPLQMVLRDIMILNQTTGIMATDPEELLRVQERADLMKYSLIVVACLPVMILYPFVQKYFVKGVMIGAIKG